MQIPLKILLSNVTDMIDHNLFQYSFSVKNVSFMVISYV